MSNSISSIKRLAVSRLPLDSQGKFLSGKNFFFILLLLPALGFSQSSTTPTNTNPVKQDLQGPAIQFKEETWDFGDIPQGVPVTHVFEYSNIGKQPLLVSQATASCGCTTPVWTKEPVLPGKTGTVSATFNAAREGTFMKTITVLSNTGEPKYLTIKGNVVAKKSDDK